MTALPAALQRVHDSFAQQGAMQTLQATVTHVAPGEVDIAFPWAQGLTQQNGYVHAGMLSSALDSACGYAGLTLMPEGANVLTIEFKVNLLAPAVGALFRCEGRVVKPGRTIMVAEGRAYAPRDGHEKLIATMTCTLMVMPAVEGASA